MTGRVLVDARPLQDASAVRGIGTYVRGLLAGLAETGWAGRCAVLVDAARPVPALPDAGFVAYAVHRRQGGRFAAYEDAAVLARDLARVSPALFHATTLSLPFRCPVPLVVTVHDVIPWAWGGGVMRGERLRFLLSRRLLRAAAAVITPSSATASDVRRLVDVREAAVRPIPEGVAPGFRRSPDAAERVQRRWGLAGPYLLHVGSLDRRKDPGSLLRAWERARREIDCELVLAGRPGPQAPADLRGARVVGEVTHAELVDLYSAAGCLAFTSRYEGFGLPVLEALACGCPVVAFRNSSLPEVAGPVGILVADGDADALGAEAARVLGDRDWRRRVQDDGPAWARPFTWERAAAATAGVYAELLT